MPDEPQDKPPPAKIEQRVKEYIAVRDAIANIKATHEKQLAPYVDLQNRLTGLLQEYMSANGADAIKTPNGTCYMTTRYSASLADPEAFMKYVIAEGKFDLLDRKANVTACKDYVAEHNAPPPGVNMSSISTVGVRRPSK